MTSQGGQVKAVYVAEGQAVKKDNRSWKFDDANMQIECNLAK